MVRTVQPVLEDGAGRTKEAAEGCCAGRVSAAWYCCLSGTGIAGGTAISLPAALGEFSAVIFIASSNIARKTEVTSLMIFVRLQEFDYPAVAPHRLGDLAASLLLPVQH